jgi:hypothetical protein
MSRMRDISWRQYAIFTGGGNSIKNLPHNSGLNVVVATELTRIRRALLRRTSRCSTMVCPEGEFFRRPVDVRSKRRAHEVLTGGVALARRVETVEGRGRGGGPSGPIECRTPLNCSLINDPCINTAINGSIARA